MIEGRREGASVRFIKIYDDLDRPTPHLSTARSSRAATRSQGEWTIPGDWSGTFLMIRGAGAEAAEERKVERGGR